MRAHTYLNLSNFYYKKIVAVFVVVFVIVQLSTVRHS